MTCRRSFSSAALVRDIKHEVASRQVLSDLTSSYLSSWFPLSFLLIVICAVGSVLVQECSTTAKKRNLESRSRPVIKLGLGAGAARDGVLAPVLSILVARHPSQPCCALSVTPVPRHMCLHSAGKRSSDRSRQLPTPHLTTATPFRSSTRAPRGSSVIHSLLRAFRCKAYSTRVCADRWVCCCELPSSLNTLAFVLMGGGMSFHGFQYDQARHPPLRKIFDYFPFVVAICQSTPRALPLCQLFQGPSKTPLPLRASSCTGCLGPMVTTISGGRGTTEKNAILQRSSRQRQYQQKQASSSLSTLLR
jgi:hypothetical protein